ncbi:GPALPP motifs-containing protein 1 isoform X1 [Bombina bombina]|uniref:GPALPP motifs-containing protein 1 isoform X1 n=1 Tax=Bombina bombina TaxID=8345 RepID=UPI00235A6999|nr:GPALPP motifs-containing protein 1 isoform X1 [Bombina bombina]
MSGDVIGPALPPGYRSHEDDDLEEVAGPVLPPGYKCDQNSDSSDDSDQDKKSRLWDHRRRSHTSEENESKPRNEVVSSAPAEDEDDDDDGFFGPALPPGFKKQPDSPERPVIGPALPPDFRKIESEDEDYIGLQKPPGFEEKASESSEDEDIIGPLPADGPVKSSVAEDFERRALKMKEKLTGKDDDGPKNTIRESWMTELPPEMTSFGLGPRTFKRKTNEKSGDRSIWTDTPADREKKGKEKKEGKISSNKNEEQFPLSDRDKRLAEQVSTHNDSKRSKSLMDLHRTKLKRKAEEDKNKPQERRPFDRDQDLQVNRFDDAQKKALIRKSKELNTKFSHGNSSMFL